MRNFELHSEKQERAFYSEKDIILCASGIQWGKGVSMEELIFTPSGYKKAKEIKSGDYLIDRNGEQTKVIGVFKQGVRPCYKLTFSDGRFIILDDNHLNIIIDPHCRGEHLLTTKELYEKRCYWDKKKGNTAQIPAISKPIILPEINLPISPYIMGVLLGDGCIVRSIVISNPDLDIIERVKKELPLDMKLNKKDDIEYVVVHKERQRTKKGYGYNVFIEHLKRYNLLGKKSDTKFIPDEYLYSSVQQRIDLLNGLMDTDGYVTKGNKLKTMQYYSTSIDLANGVVWLVESLGGKAWIKEKIPYYTYKGEKKQGKKCYNVSIISDINPFYLKRKADQYFKHNHTKNKVLKKVEIVERRETICFKVDSPTESFVIKGQIVTHNSTVGALRTRLLASRHNSKDDNFIVAAPTYKVLEQSTKRAFLNVFGDIGRFYKSDGIYQIKNGPTFYFRSGHDPDSVVGITNVRGVWGDEAGLFTKYFADNLFARAAFRNAQVIFTTSPYSLNWILKDIINPTLKGKRNDVELIQAQSCENPYFPRAVYEKRRLTMDPRRFKTIYGGEFDRPEGMVYDCWDEDIIHIDKFICDSPATTNFYGACDWGFKDPFVLLTRAISDHGIHTDVSEFVKSGLRPSDIVKFMISKHSIFHYKMIFCDPSRPEMIEELCSAGIPAVAAENDIREGIDAYYELISSGNYRVVAKDCPYLIDEKDSYHYPEEKDLKTDQDKSKRTDLPVDQNDHILDCARYLSMGTKKVDKKTEIKQTDINYRLRKLGKKNIGRFSI